VSFSLENTPTPRNVLLLRDRVVLSALAVISAFLLFESLYHLLIPEGERVAKLFLYLHRAAPLWVVPVVVQFLCCLYVWHRFRREAALRAELVLALQERNDEMTKFQDILESAPMRVSIQARSFKILYQNPAHIEVIGERAGEYCYSAYCHVEEVCEGCPLKKTFADGGVHTLHKKNVINGQERYLELVAAPLKKADGTIVAGIEIVQDTTAQVLHERRIRQLSERLEESNRELRAFSSALAHDLRQPLTRTYMAAQVLDEQCHKQDGDVATMVGDVLQGCVQMEELVEGMLTLSRVDHAELNLENVDLVPLIDEIILDLRVLDPERNFRLSRPGFFEVRGDRRLLRILLVNLLSNAWKYTRRCEESRLSVRCLSDAERVTVVIEDNGIGFAMQDAAKLFQPFSRLHREQGYPGIGIGLATARRVVHRHGGRIWAESIPGEKTQFFFTLPRDHVVS